MNIESLKKPRRIVGSFLVYLGGTVLVASSAVKFAQVPKVVAQFSAMGFDGHKLAVVAALEIASAGLLLIPAMRAIGFPIVNAYLGGAIATHLQHSQPTAGPAILLSLIWLGVRLRHPNALWTRSAAAGTEVDAASRPQVESSLPARGSGLKTRRA